MRRYTIVLLSMTLVLVVASLVMMLCHSPHYIAITSLVPVYFAIVTAIEHIFIVKSAQKAPRTFVKNFLGLTVGTLILHLVVMVVYCLTNIHTASKFLLAFCACYIIYLAFETTALMLYVNRQKKETHNDTKDSSEK